MAFTIFSEHTVAYASEVLNNFYWCFQGDRFPMGGVNMQYTTGVYNIGSSTYKWRDLYTSGVYITTSIINPNTWNLKSITEITAASSSFIISGLSGDNECCYKIDIWYADNGATSSLYMFPNADSSASYGFISQYTLGGAGASTRTSGDTKIIACDNTRRDTTTTNLCYSSILLFAKTGLEKTCIKREVNSFEQLTNTASYIKQLIQSNYCYSTTSVTLTSIKFESSVVNGIGVGTKVMIWSLN